MTRAGALGLDSVIGDAVGGVLGSALDDAMKSVWDGASSLMSSAFSVVDQFSTFTVDARSGPIGGIWPTLLMVSSAIALGLFFWQITLAALRGGKGMMRAATGPVAYGIALAITVTVIAAALTSADGLTTLILTQGLHVSNFTGAFTHTSLGGQALNSVKAVALGLVGFFGVLPAALGWVLEIIWRQATILVLVATVPITAAGLVAHTTSSWFWRGLRWTIAAITVKPVLAMVFVVGVSTLANGTGLTGLLAGVAVLWVSLICPVALFRLLAFVDPDTRDGQVFRDAWSQLGSRISGGGTDSGGHAGFDSGFSKLGAGGAGSSGDGDSSGVGAFESANTARFDAAGVGAGSGSDAGAPDAPAPAAVGNPGGATSSSSAGGGGSTPTSGSGSGAVTDPNPGWGADAASTTGATTGAHNGAADSGAAYSGGADSGLTDSSMAGDEEPPVPAAAAPPADTGPAHPSPHPRPSAGGGGGASSGSGGVAAGEDAAETAVIL